MKAVIFLSLLVASPVFAQTPKPASAIRGAGNETCASVKIDDGVSLGHWTLGFWSGLNAASGQPVGETATAATLVGEVNKLCEAEPSIRVSEAALRTYVRYSKR